MALKADARLGTRQLTLRSLVLHGWNVGHFFAFHGQTNKKPKRPNKNALFHFHSRFLMVVSLY